MNNTNIRKKSFTLAAMILSLSACSVMSPQKDAKIVKEIDDNAQVVQKKIQAEVVTNTGRAFIGSKIINRKVGDEELPAGFSDQITIGDGALLSISQIGQRITALTRIPVNISPELMKVASASGASAASAAPAGGASTAVALPMISVAFVGALPDFLDRVSSRMGVAWEYRDGAINFSRYITRIYSLNLFPGSSKQQATVGKSGSASTGTAGGTGAASGGGGSFSSSSASDFTTELDAWGSLSSAMAALKSSGGTYSISASTGIIVVTDTKDAQNRVERYIKKLEKTMNRQITLKVSVISAESNDNDAAGINWNLVWNRLSAIAPNYSLTFKGVQSPATLGQNGGGMGLNILAPTGGTPGMWDGTTAMFQALSSVTKASMVSNNSLSTLNKQPLSMSIADQTGYASSSMTQGVTGGNPVASTTVSTITTGFILNMTPSATDGNEVSLQFSLDLSNPPTIQTFGQIQVPTYSGTQIAQRTQLRNGETLVLSGFSLKNMAFGKNGMFTPNDPILMGGNNNKTSRDRDLVILITPIME